MLPEPPKASLSEAQKPNRKARRERQATAKRAGLKATPSASGSSTPFPKAGENSTDGRPQLNGNGNIEKEADGQPESAAATAFGGDEDFIPFDVSDASDDEAGPSPTKRDRKGKGKEIVGEDEEKEDLDRDTTTTTRRRRGKGRERDEPSSPRAKEKSTARDRDAPSRASEREWDRGKARADDDRYGNGGGRNESRNGRSHKRKHDEYDDNDGYSNKKQRIDAASRKCPWVNGLDLERCQNVAEMMHKEVDSFVDWISPTPVEDEIRGLIVAQISKVISITFPDAEVFPFGSYQTKLYLPLGDIDLVVLSDSMAYSDKSTVLHVLANALKRGGITSHVTIIAKAKVPIVKFVTNHGRFKVDISINQGNGLVSGQIITGFLRDMIPSKDPESKALRSLVMVTKAFLSQRSMNEVYTGGLGSYSIVCLAVSFLQMHPKIRRGEIDPEKNLGVLLMEFFELYGHYFNYDEVGISLREGGTYFNKRQRGWHAEYKRNMLSIEDPADPSNDISSGSYNFHKVRTAFAGAHGILTSTAYLRASMLSSRHHGRSVHLRGHYEPEDLSILSTVMGITQETVNHRRLVQELYDRRVLHSIVGVKPLPPVVTSVDERSDSRRERESSSSSKAKASRAVVDSAWENTHQNDESDCEEPSRSRRHRPEDDEGGRYDIGRQPPKKRRKTGRAEDAHTVYFVDDDEDEESVREQAYDEEEGEYLSDESDRDERRPSRSGNAKNDNRRSYWLSKGMGGFEGDSS